MTIDQKVIDDIDDHMANLADLGNYLDKVYYNTDFATIFTKPVLSMLITATRYLSDNLEVLKQKYRTNNL